MRLWLLTSSLKNFRKVISCTNASFYTRSSIYAPTTVKMPSLSPTMSEGTIVAWNKKVGDTVVAGDMLCEIQTDKAVVPMDADEDGILAKILQPAGGDNVAVGQPIALIASTDEDWESVAANHKTVDVTQLPKQTETSSISKSSPVKESKSLVGPAARTLIEKNNLELDQIVRSGPHNTVTKDDVLKHLSQHQNDSTESKDISPSYIDIPLTSMRKTIAKRLSQSKTNVPHLYTRTDIKVDALLEMRKVLKNQGISLSINDFVIKATALALVMAPELNAISNEEDKLELLNNVDICVAVSTPAGLITPIVQNADKLPITEISARVKDLATRARDNKLKPNEFQGGGFTISNLGMFGIREFTSIINLPQVAIIAIGGGMEIMDPKSHEFVTQITLTLSTDARFIDEVTASRFLRNMNRLIAQNPQILVEDDAKIRPFIPLSFESQMRDFSVDSFVVEQLSGY